MAITVNNQSSCEQPWVSAWQLAGFAWRRRLHATSSTVSRQNLPGLGPG